MMAMPSTVSQQEIACQQVLVEDSSVFSVQWSLFPHSIADTLIPENLLTRYLDYVRKCTCSIIRPCLVNGGIEFRLLGTTRSLISFLAPRLSDDVLTLHICGGLLVQPRQCARGELRFGIERLPEGVRVSLQLSDFCPLILGGPSPSHIRYWLYRLTQATIHRLVTVRFLKLLYRDLAGATAAVRVVNVSVRDGRPV